MINSTMREYDYLLYSEENNYGQAVLNDTVAGQVKMSINIASQSIQDNINYKDCQYIGLTHNKNIDDNYVIVYGKEQLKVLYVNPLGRLNQVFMAAI